MRFRPDDFLQPKVNYLQPLEKSWFTRGLAPMQIDEVQPSLGFGIMAVSKFIKTTLAAPTGFKTSRPSFKWIQNSLYTLT